MADYSYVPQHLTLRPGDVLFLYTDGITEAENDKQEQFSVARMLESLEGVVSDPPAEVVAAVIAAVRAHAGETPPSDDLTALALRFRGVPVVHDSRVGRPDRRLPLVAGACENLSVDPTEGCFGRGPREDSSLGMTASAASLLTSAGIDEEVSHVVPALAPDACSPCSLSASPCPSAAGEHAIPDEAALRAVTARFAPVDLGADISRLPDERAPGPREDDRGVPGHGRRCSCGRCGPGTRRSSSSSWATARGWARPGSTRSS